jgi:putative IMPACT (imprinted ancient) family translation regulator
VRYFGGTKLGVGGLINAYRSSARLALESSIIEEKTIDTYFHLNFEYELMSKVLRIIKENSIIIKNQKLDMNCELIISIRKSNANKIFKIFKVLYKLKIKSLDI